MIKRFRFVIKVLGDCFCPMFRHISSSVFAVCLVLAPELMAQGEDVTPRAPVPWLDWVAEEMAFALTAAEEAVDAEPVEDLESAAPVPLRDTSAELARLHNEMREVRSELRHLRATLDYYMEGVVTKTQEENVQLRAELQRIYALQQNAPEAIFPGVPRPNYDLVAEVLSQTVENLMKDAPLPVVPPDSPEGGTGFQYEIISQWGREPEQDEVQSGEVSSLKGMVCLVPPRSRREDIVQLGRELRAEFDRYDNINVEIFDEPAAARSFAETNVSTGPEHRVFSISKHRASGRDTMVYFEDGVAKEVPEE